MTRRRVLGFWCNGTKTEKKLGRKYLRQREREEQTRLGITDANSLPSFPTFSHPQILLMYTSFFPFLPSLFFYHGSLHFLSSPSFSLLCGFISTNTQTFSFLPSFSLPFLLRVSAGTHFLLPSFFSSLFSYHVNELVRESNNFWKLL